MPTKHLNKRLVERLKRVAPRLLTPERFRKMKNVDHRQHWTEAPGDGITGSGHRVRELRVRKENSRIPVVIKRDHLTSTPEKTVKYLRSIVGDHNKIWQPENYRIYVPHAYALNEHYLAMAKTNYPSLTEIIGKFKTPRGTKFFKRLAKKHGVTLEEFKRAASSVSKRTAIPFGNLMLIGVRNKRFIFVPLVDQF